MIRCLFALLFALAALVASSPAQRTYTVGLIGDDFRNLTDALAAVSPGDTLIVRQYSLEDVSTSKGVRIVGSIGAGGPLAGVLTVHGLPEDQTFTLVNFFGPVFPGKNFRLALKDNRGKVHVDGIFISGGTERSLVKIESSAHVSINECELWDLAISDSKVLITDSAVRGYDGNQSRNPSSAIIVTGTELTLADCLVVGGFGPYATAVPPPPPGIDMDGGSLLATGTSQSCIQGGRIYNASGRLVGPAIRSDNGSVVLHPDVQLNGRFPGLPLTTGTSQFTKRRVPFMEVHRVPPGSTQFPLLPARLFADTGSLGGILASLPGKPFSFSMGELWLDPATSIYVGSGVLPAGTDPMFEIGIPVPAAVPLGSTFTFQSLVLLQGGQAMLSTPVEVALAARSSYP